jgi:hypothetical protein
MIVTRNYHKLESITYRLDEYDIRQACEQYLEKNYKVKRHEGRWTFEIWEDDDDKTVAEFVQRFTTEIAPETTTTPPQGEEKKDGSRQHPD